MQADGMRLTDVANKNTRYALPGGLVGWSVDPGTTRLWVQCLTWTPAWAVGLIPGWGTWVGATDQGFSLTLTFSLSLPRSLKLIKTYPWVR